MTAVLQPETPPRGLVLGPVADLARFMVRKSPWATAGLMVLMCLSSVTEGVSLLLLLPVLRLIDPDHPSRDLLVPTGPLEPLFGPSIAIGLGAVLTLLALLISARAMLTRQRDIVNARLLQDLSNSLRNETFLAVTRTRWSFLAQMRGSDLSHALTSDIDRVRAAASAMLQIVQTLVLLVIYCGAALIVSPTMMVTALCLGAVILGLLAPVRRLALAHGSKLSAQGQEQYRIVSEFLGGLKVAKATNTEPQFASRLANVLERARESNLRFMRMFTVAGLFFQIGTAVGLALFIWVAVTRVQLPLAGTATLVLLFMRIGPRLAAIHGSSQFLLTNVTALRLMGDLRAACDANAEVDPLQPDASSGQPHGNGPHAFAAERRGLRLEQGVIFEGVSFAYGGNRKERVLRAVSFPIQAGKITALIGPSGSGKSTVADLLMGLLEPSEGRITVDGIELTANNRREWRRGLAYVPQDCFLLHDTIAENLRMGNEALTDPDLWEALAQAHARDLVASLPIGLQTIVGDRGHWLSGGERQRIALARALLTAPRLLVLDEATSALDWETQAGVARSIRALRGRMTILTIAHRPSMVAFADDIVVLEQGIVASQGTFDEQAEGRGSYLSRILGEADEAALR